MATRRGFLRLAGSGAGMVLLAACGGAPPTATQPPPTKPAAEPTKPPAAGGGSIKIGALIPLTGPSAAPGQDMKNGYELAKDQINAAGGVGGKQLEMVYEDDKNDPATAVAS